MPPFFSSSVPVGQNVVKNILFRGSAIVLNFVVYRFFTFLAFRRNDYTSFLMFAEDAIQTAFFAVDRRFNSQAVLVLAFGGMTLAAGFYDTLIWALDSPGYVLRTKRVGADTLSAQILPNAAYVTFIPNNVSDVDIQTTLGTNLFVSGLDFALPGVFAMAKGEVVPAQEPLTVLYSAPRVWLDIEGFAVGLDQRVMWAAGCAASSVPSAVPDTQVQAWSCPTNNSDTAAVFAYPMGRPQIWWDLNHPELLQPDRKENPWYSLEQNGETAIMKQVFTVTKGKRRHTFLQTMLKATMLGIPTLDDGEVVDLIRRTWSYTPTGPSNNASSATVQSITDVIIGAKHNGTSHVIGGFIQTNISVASFSAEFLNAPRKNSTTILYSVLRTILTETTLLSSETLPEAPVPFGPCELVYRNVAVGGTVRSTNCNTAAVAVNQNLTQIPQTGLFLGQVDVSAMVIMSDILGDGKTSTSAGAFSQTGFEWYLANAQTLDQLLTSRAMIVGGARAAVMVDVTTTQAAVSYLQLLLVTLPLALALGVLAATFRVEMSYFGSSFVAAVLATTHITSEECREVGYMRRVPEIGLQRSGGHVVLKTPFGGTIANVAGENVGAMIYEPLILKTKVPNGGWET